MYLIIRRNKDETEDYFGPFPTYDRAIKYAEQFETIFAIELLIVPNCVTVTLNY
jgi:hypothetical protein